MATLVFEILLWLVRRMAAQGRLALRAIVVIVDVDELRARRLLQDELIVGERLIQIQLHYRQGNREVLRRKLDVDDVRKHGTSMVAEVVVMDKFNNLAPAVIEVLVAWAKVNPAEDDLTREKIPGAVFSQYDYFVVGLLHILMSLRVLNDLHAFLQHGYLAGRLVHGFH